MVALRALLAQLRRVEEDMLADGAPVTGQGGPGTAALGGRTTTAAPAGPAGPAVPVAPQAAQQAATPATHQTAQQAMRWRDLHQRCGPLRRPLVADGLLLALLRLDSAAAAGPAG